MTASACECLRGYAIIAKVWWSSAKRRPSGSARAGHEAVPLELEIQPKPQASPLTSLILQYVNSALARTGRASMILNRQPRYCRVLRMFDGVLLAS